MKKKLFFITILLFWSIAFSVIVSNQYIKSNYGLNIIEYIKYSSPLNASETKYLKDKGSILFVSDKNAPPFAYIDKTDGQYKGLALDYANALSLVLGTEIKFIPKEWDEAILSLEAKDADVCDMFPSPERKKRFLFSNVIYKMQGIIVTKKDETVIRYFEDLKGKQVAIPSGDYANEYVKTNSDDITVVQTGDISSAIDLLLDGKVNAIIGDEPVIIYQAKQKGVEDQLNILNPVLYQQNVCLGVNKTDPMLVKVLNKGIFRLKKQNLVENIQQKWFGLSVSINNEQIPFKLLFSIIITVNFLIIVFAIYLIQSHNLKIQVRKRTMDLDKSRHDLQMTLDALSAYLIVISSDGTIANVNNTFCKRMNMKKQDIIGKNQLEFPFIAQILHNVLLEDTNELKGSRIIKLKDRILNVSVFHLTDSEHTLIVADDVTDQVASQKQLLQDNKMIAVGQLAAGVAHEIRNPLGNIRNYSYILKKRIDTSDAVLAQSIDVIETSVQKAGNIINNLLNFSRIKNDGWQKENIRDLIENILLLVREEINSKNVTINVNCDPSLEYSIKVESMNHIILNLIANSIDAMQNGSVHGKIVIDCSITNEILCIDFSDNGHGIPEEDLEHIFNPFFTTKHMGTGLGLYIVYNEINKMGGTIRVDSKVNIGSIFRLQIPKMEVNDNGCI